MGAGQQLLEYSLGDGESEWLAIPRASLLSHTRCQIIGFGFLLCLDSFLYTFTIQPIRFVIAVSRYIYNLITWSKSHLPPSQKADILRTLLVIVSIALLIPLADASKIYHSIRGQDTIKLYVIFNSLEVSTVHFFAESLFDTHMLRRSQIGCVLRSDKTYLTAYSRDLRWKCFHTKRPSLLTCSAP